MPVESNVDAPRGLSRGPPRGPSRGMPPRGTDTARGMPRGSPRSLPRGPSRGPVNSELPRGGPSRGMPRGPPRGVRGPPRGTDFVTKRPPPRGPRGLPSRGPSRGPPRGIESTDRIAPRGMPRPRGTEMSPTARPKLDLNSVKNRAPPRGPRPKLDNAYLERKPPSGRGPPPEAKFQRRPPPGGSRPPPSRGFTRQPPRGVRPPPSRGFTRRPPPSRGPPRSTPPPPRGARPIMRAPPTQIAPKPPNQAPVNPPTSKPPNLKLSGENEIPAPPKRDAPMEHEFAPRPGRLKITLQRGRDVRRMGPQAALESSEADIFLRFSFGAQREPVVKETKIYKGMNSYPFFDDEMVEFDIDDPETFIRDDELPLKVEVFHKTTFSQELMGETVVSALPYFEGVPMEVEYKLKWTYKVNNEVKPAGALDLQVHFESVNHGLLLIKAHHGKHLKNMDKFGRQDPYCKFTLAGQNKKGKTIQKGGSNPYFNEEEFEFWIDANSWNQHMLFECWDEDVGVDDFIGSCKFPVLEFCKLKPKTKVKRWLQLLSKNEKEERGEVELSFEFFQAGKLRVRPTAARRLFAGNMVVNNCSVLCTVDNMRLPVISRRTKCDKDGRSEPIWDDLLQFDIVNQYEMELRVQIGNTSGDANLVGKNKVSLLPYFQKGCIEEWIKIYNNKRDWGERSDMGEVLLSIDFTGPKGIFYPQRQDMIDSFDERERISFQEMRLQKKSSGAFEKDRADKMRENEVDARYGVSDEFTDKEIFDAFRFIDLDKNMFIGSAEIRHILVCMGELVTDEEINEMVSMVDLDGDGQVSYEEFYRLAKHPDPSKPDFSRALVRTTQQGAFKNGIPGPPPSSFPRGIPPPPRNVPRGMPRMQLDNAPIRAPRGNAGPLTKPGMSNIERQRLMMRKAEKRKLLQKFTNDNSTDMDFLELAYKTFRDLPSTKGEQTMNIDQFCQILKVEKTGEYVRLFDLFDSDKSGSIDVKEFMIGLSNFASKDQRKKVRFCFLLYDEDRNGFIEEEELIKILLGSHNLDPSQVDAVKRKAKTIMRQADKNGDGKISPEEFEMIAVKFPNILFPAAQYAPSLRGLGRDRVSASKNTKAPGKKMRKIQSGVTVSL